MTRLALGTQLGPYRVVELLGAGGMGEVYRAQDTRLGRTVALKLLPEERSLDPERRQRMLQEAQTVSALNHPNILGLHDLAEADGQQFLVLEYVAGRTLDQVIPRLGLPLQDAVRYAVQMASALAAAHEAGVIHRDLKPGNIMVTDKGR
jgi:serine/threonine-protein kinase